MGRLFLVDLADSDDPEAHLIVCRTCHTHIALRQHIILSLSGAYWLGLSNTVNLQVHGAEQSKVEGHTFVDIRCVKCGDRLGVKCIKDEQPCRIQHEGTYNFLKSKLDHWNSAHQYRNVEPTDFT